MWHLLLQLMLLSVARLVAFATAEPLRVAYLHNALPLGGVETHILNLCTHLDRSRVSPHVFLFDDFAACHEARLDPQELLPAVIRAGCPVYVHPVRTTTDHVAVVWNATAYADLVAALRRGAFDVAFTFFGGIHPTEPGGRPLGVVAAAAAGVARQVQHIEWKYAPLAGLPLDAIEVQTTYVMRQCQRAGVVYPLHFVTPGIDVAELAPPPPATATSPSLASTSTTLAASCPPAPARTFPAVARQLVVGRLSRLIAEKDPYTFVLAARPTADALTRGPVTHVCCFDMPAQWVRAGGGASRDMR